MHTDTMLHWYTRGHNKRYADVSVYVYIVYYVHIYILYNIGICVCVHITL